MILMVARQELLQLLYLFPALKPTVEDCGAGDPRFCVDAGNSRAILKVRRTIEWQGESTGS